MNGLPDGMVYAALAAGAAIENFVPAVPADTFVALGGFLAGAGYLDARWVMLGTWLANVAGALFVYRMSYVHGRGFFEQGWGRHIVRPHQMQRIGDFYHRWGTPAIFLSRFLPGIRSIVPVFAGLTYRGWLEVALPITVASAIWYGGLVQLGLFAGRNLDLLGRLLGGLNRTLVIAAGLVAVLIVGWWLLTRRHPDE
jgi:membrane protein DedA with SNARE-associated domain